jgi:hypothetical protein
MSRSVRPGVLTRRAGWRATATSVWSGDELPVGVGDVVYRLQCKGRLLCSDYKPRKVLKICENGVLRLEDPDQELHVVNSLCYYVVELLRRQIRSQNVRAIKQRRRSAGMHKMLAAMNLPAGVVTWLLVKENA